MLGVEKKRRKRHVRPFVTQNSENVDVSTQGPASLSWRKGAEDDCDITHVANDYIFLSIPVKTRLDEKPLR